MILPKEPTEDIRRIMHQAYWQTPHLPYHDGSPALWNAVYEALYNYLLQKEENR